MSEKPTFSLIAAPFTPFGRGGKIDMSVIEAYGTHLARNGICGAFVCGTTGEALSMSEKERRAVAEKWMEVSSGKLDVIVHVGSNAIRESIALAAHAQAIGAKAVAAFSPSFFRPSDAAGLVGFLKPVAAAAPKLPFYYYHMPSMTGVNVAASRVAELAKASIPNFAGIKFTHSDLYDMQRCMCVDGVKIFHGYDETLLCGLSLGVGAAVGSTYNYMPTIYRNLVDAFQSGDLGRARWYQSQSVGMVDVLVRHGGGVRAGKAIMNIAGIACGECRMPIAPFSAEEFRELEREVMKLGLLDDVGSIRASPACMEPRIRC